MSIGFIHEPMVVGSTQMQERIENMATTKRRFWQHAEFGVYFLATRLGEQPGAVQALEEANSLVNNYLSAGYEPIDSWVIGNDKLVLQGSGELDGVKVVVLWGLQSWLDPDVQAKRIRDMEDAGVKRIE